MEFFELVDEVAALLRQRGRVSYRALKRQFDLDDALVEDVKLELVEAQGVAADEAGMFLVARERPADSASPAAEGGASSPARPEPGAAPRPTEEGAGASRPTATTEPAGGEAMPEGWGAPEAERRQLSVLFCDLVGSSALAAALDPEDLRAVLDEYQRLCAGVIERHGGVIARQVGDGLLVNFGYPRAHEDDARRAARAGLAIVAALPELNGRLAPRYAALRTHPLQVRIGLHTGLVVVGALGDSTYRDPMAVVGETPNIAARLQGLAEADTVVVSGATRRLLGEPFHCEDLGLHELKGVPAPVAVYRVQGEREDGEAGRGAEGARTTPLVGREQEVAVLIGRWEQSTEGPGEVVLLSGEAGIGKSRLVQELKRRVADEPHVRLEGRGSPHHQQSAFYPFTDLLQRALRFEPTDSAEVKREKLAEALRHYGLSVTDLLPWLGGVLNLPGEPSSEAVGALTPPQQRQRTLQALVATMLGLAAREPLLLIIEDLHWVDPSSLEVLELLLPQVRSARLLLVLTARPDFRIPWLGAAPLTRLTLMRLDRAQVARVMAAVAGGKALPGVIVEEVARKTDGVPLFIEELTKMVLESGLLREGAAGYELTGPLPPLAIPATLQDSLTARLDRLATTKLVAQLGATIGRSFSYELLRAVAGLDEGTLTAELRKLVEAELVYQRGFPPTATYTFKHALIQDAAYAALLRSTRQQYHRRVAQVLETQFPETVETQPEILAHHHAEAGLAAQAIPYWQRAGQRAMERSANLEATAHLTRALELLGAQPETAARAVREVDLRIALGLVLRVTKGYTAPDVEQNNERALALCEQLDDIPRRFLVLTGLWEFHVALGQRPLAMCLDMAEEMLGLSQRHGDLDILARGHGALGMTLWFQGEFARAREHKERQAALYDPDQPRRDVLLQGQDRRVAGLTALGLILWALGYPDQALERSREALAWAKDLSHQFSLVVATGYLAWLHQFRREPRETQECCEAVIALATEHGFPIYLAQGTILRGWALAAQGQGAEGTVLIRGGVTRLRAAGMKRTLPSWLALLGEARMHAGEPREGLSVVAEALAQVDESGERMWEAELHRLKGQLLLMDTPRHPDAEPCFLHAVDVARRQEAKSLELRATVSLARLWHEQGKRTEARQALAAIYGWFTEGFDTADLRDARTLLEV